MAPALVLAGAVAAPALLPFVDYLPQTLRASRELNPQRGSLAEHWLPIVAPNAYGNSRYVDYWGLNNTNEDAAGFCGTVTLLAVLLGLWAGRRFPQERLFLAVAVLCLLLLSPWGPGTRRLLLPLAFSLSYLGACTLERVRLGGPARGTWSWRSPSLCTVIAWGYLGHRTAALEPLRTGSLYWQGRFLVLGSFLLAFGGRRWTAPAAAALIAAELLLFHLPANPPMPQRLANVPNAPIRFLQDHLGITGWPRWAGASPPTPLCSTACPTPGSTTPWRRPSTSLVWSRSWQGWWGEMPELGYRGRRDTRVYRNLGVRYLLTDPGVRLPLPLAFRDSGRLDLRDPRSAQTARPDLPPAHVPPRLPARRAGPRRRSALAVPPPTARAAPTRSEGPG